MVSASTKSVWRLHQPARTSIIGRLALMLYIWSDCLINAKIGPVFNGDTVMLQFRNIGLTGPNRNRRHRYRAAILSALLFATVFAPVLNAQTKPAKPKSGTGIRVDDKGRKFINNIPLDVFFDNPLEIVSSNKNPAGTADAPPTAPTKTEAAPPASNTSGATPPAKTGETAWQELIPMDELQGEVKSLRNSLTKAMTNPASYNSGFKAIAIDGAEMAALAGIVQQHTDTLSWKDKSQYARDFGAQLNQSAVGLGKENFEKTRAAFQRLASVLDGSIPADAGNVPENRPFHEAASRKALMKRIEKAKDWLKQDVNSEAKFKSMAAQIKHEAAIISALATVVTTEGYEYVTEDEYQKHARSLIDGALEASSASQDESYDRFKQAVDRVNKSCTDCHATYGNG